MLSMLRVRWIPQEETCEIICFVSPHSFPLPTHTQTCTHKFMTTLEKAVKLSAMIVHVHCFSVDHVEVERDTKAKSLKDSFLSPLLPQ